MSEAPEVFGKFSSITDNGQVFAGSRKSPVPVKDPITLRLLIYWSHQCYLRTRQSTVTCVRLLPLSKQLGTSRFPLPSLCFSSICNINYNSFIALRDPQDGHPGFKVIITRNLRTHTKRITRQRRSQTRHQNLPTVQVVHLHLASYPARLPQYRLLDYSHPSRRRTL